MNSVLINVSNHNSNKWEASQKEHITKIIDLTFPQINPELDSIEVGKIVDQYFDEIKNFYNLEKTYDPSVNVLLHLAGEYSFCYMLFQKIRKEIPDITFVIATTQRVTVETPQPDGSTRKESVFRFVRWRII